MSLAGMGAVAIWHDILPEAQQEYREWHSREHMPERVGIPGFRRGRRYVALEGGPEFFTLYEADSAEVLGGLDYLNRLNAPTEWTRRMMPSFRNFARSQCRVVVTSGTGCGGMMLTLRFDVAAPHRAGALEALTQRILQPLNFAAGVTGVHLCLADEAASRIETVERTTRPDALQVPAWIALIEGIAPASVRGAGDTLAAALPSLHASAIATALYRHEVTRLKTPWSAG
jgi:hypothetical protein